MERNNIMANNIVSTDKKTPKKNDKLLHRTVTICVVLLLVLCAGLFIWKKNARASDNRLEDSVAAQLGQLDGKSEAEIQEELNRVVEEGTMAISINVNPVFSDGASEGTLEIENVPSNKYAQVVSITLDDSGKEIYNSGLIQSNYHIQTDKLSEALAAGTYDCTATFTAYDTSDSENPIEVGSAAAKITISVLS